MKVKMTKAEKEIYETLDDAGKQAYMREKDVHRKSLMLKSLALTNCLIKTFEQLDKYNVTKGKLKVAEKPYKHQLLLVLKEAYGVGNDDDKQEQIKSELDEYLKDSCKQLDKLLK